MSDFGDKGGISGLVGYRYQSLLALYFLVVKESREIEWEADGEDVTIVNEDPNRLSMEYIQAKYRESGSFSLNEFKKTVLNQFWTAYCNGIKNHPHKLIKCTLITNIAWDRDLKIFIDGCKNYRERGISIETSINSIKRKYDSIKGDKDPEEFRRFLFGLNVIHQFPPEQIHQEIISYLKECGIIERRAKILQMLQVITENGQGVITRRIIEDIAGKQLSPISITKTEATYGKK